MITLTRHSDNPIVTPIPTNTWEHDGSFNGCVAYANGVYHMVYRALSSPQKQNGVELQVSSVGYCQSTDGVHFGDHKLLFGPTEDWEIYGVEDPRITYMDGNFYIFYTALSVYPFAAYGIKLAVAKTKDFQSFEKHQVTPFNAKAMGMFDEKVNGKMAALLTMHTDLPPSKIALAIFDRESDIWSPFFWKEWYDNANDHIINLQRDMRDQIELGGPPLKTDHGWLVIYSYIKNYLSHEKDFGIEAVLLDSTDPKKIIGRTNHFLLSPVAHYEKEGLIPNIVFPSGCLIKDNTLYVYYGGADTVTAVATCELDKLLSTLVMKESK